MRVGLLTREYPPEVYGGAGVHVEYLARELRELVDVEVRCFGEERESARAFRPPAELAGANQALQTMGVDLFMAADLGGASGRRSSSAAATGFRPSASAPRSRRPTPSSRCRLRCARTS